MKLFLSSLIFAAALTATISAQADLKSSFKALDAYKGPFSLNYIQGTQGRVAVRDSDVPPGQPQFQAAFRNDLGKTLATQYDFYVGNLFTTNYYELTGTYVYNNTYGSFELNEQALLEAAPQALPQAASMVRHWVLEKSYVNFFPDSGLGRAFKLRGISGAEFEQQYAAYFFNFYLSAITEDYQFLPAYLLAKSSPIADSSSLEKARDMAAKIYDQMKLQYGEKDPAVAAMYQLRNAIHNQLSQDIIGQIDTYERNYSYMGNAYGGTLSQIQDILRAYYSVNAKRIAELAGVAGAADVQNLALAIAQNGLTTARALSLSQAITALRTSITDPNAVPYGNKTSMLVLMFSTSQYLNKELSAQSMPASKEVLKSVINLLYVEGFLIKDNWQYFLSETDNAADLHAAAALIPDIADIANDTLTQAFKPALDQWISVEPKMQYFIDNTIKSSALNTASIVAKKIN